MKLSTTSALPRGWLFLWLHSETGPASYDEMVLAACPHRPQPTWFLVKGRRERRA